MNVLDQILENYPEDEFVKAEGFDDAIIGVEYYSLRLVYSVTKVLEILEKEGSSETDAIEHFTFNMSCGYSGEQAPIWCWDNFY